MVFGGCRPHNGGLGCSWHRYAAGHVADAAGEWRGAAECSVCFPILIVPNPGAPRRGSAALGCMTYPRWGWSVAKRSGERQRLPTKALGGWKRAEEEEGSSPRESGVGDAGLRLESLPPHSKTLARWLGGGRKGGGSSRCENRSSLLRCLVRRFVLWAGQSFRWSGFCRLFDEPGTHGGGGLHRDGMATGILKDKRGQGAGSGGLVDDLLCPGL